MCGEVTAAFIVAHMTEHKLVKAKLSGNEQGKKIQERHLPGAARAINI